ncbi:MAG TPA: hypothetical protein PKL83_01930, partial [bacterium]|nr:hypothetical protein [bacterium]
APERLVLTPSGTVRPLTVTIQPVREEAVPADDDSQTRGVAISSAAAQEHPARRARNVLAIDRNSVPKTGGAPGSEFFSSVAELAGQGVRGINVSTTTHVPITSTNEPVPVRCALQPKKITITKPTAITKPAVVSVSTLEKTVEEQPIPPKPEKKLIKPELRFQ